MKPFLWSHGSKTLQYEFTSTFIEISMISQHTINLEKKNLGGYVDFREKKILYVACLNYFRVYLRSPEKFNF
jgi:hypothetical protein